MLVLSRRVGQEICIAGDIRVVVLEATGSRVRLGIVAPPQVPIWRREILHSAPTAPQPRNPSASASRKAS